MLKRKQEREGQAISMKKVTGNPKKRRLVNILLNAVGINTAAAKISTAAAQARHSHLPCMITSLVY